MNFRRLVSAVAALAVAGTCVVTSGVSALAATEEVDFIGTSTTAETFDSYSGTNWSSDITFGTNDGNNHFALVSANGDNGYISGYALSAQVRGGSTRTATYTLSDKVTNGTVYFNSAIGTYTTSGFSDISLKFLDSSGNAVTTISTSSTGGSGNYNSYLKLGSSTTTGYSDLYVASSLKDFKVALTIDLDNATATAVFTYVNKSTSAESTETLTTSIAESSNIASFTMSTTAVSKVNRGVRLDNTQFYAMTSNETTYPYTITYTLNNTPIAVSTGEDIDGASVKAVSPLTVSADDETYGDYAGRYYPTDDATTTFTVDATGENKWTVPVRSAYTFDATLTSSVDDSIVASQKDLVEGDSTTLYYPAYVVFDDAAYASSSTGNSSHYYGIDLDYDIPTLEITYSETNYSNVVYYSEAENISGMTARSDTARMAGGAGAYSTDGVELATLSAGTYVVITATRSQSGGDLSSKAVFKAGDETLTFYDDYNAGTYEGTTTAGATSYGFIKSYVSDEFTVENGTTITLTSETANANVDYVLIAEVTPTIKSVEVTTATAEKSDPAPTALTGVGVSDTTLTGLESVTTYLIKVANYTTTLGNPTLVTTSGDLQPSESTIEYGYSSGGYKYFVIQTIGIDKASSVQLDSCEDYDL